MKQIDTSKLEQRLGENSLAGQGAEATARTIFWIRLCNLLGTAHELLIDQVKKLKDEKS